METSPESPAPVRRISALLAQYVGRLGAVWLEGQVTQCTRRPGTRTAFLTLRDAAADVSLPVTVPVDVLDALPAPLREGAAVVVHAKPSFWPARGTLSMAADELRSVGVGALLARLEELKRVLSAEGLFAPERKRPLPFLPHVVGLVCGRASAAERDVVENARRRWPAVRFRVEEVAVQGPNAVTEVVGALQRLEADREVDVIVVTRGGGSVEDLLPFSNEAMVRAVAACFTPVVSAIGHEVDAPLLDLVADVRASTPTDAAKRVVPDMEEELARVASLRERAFGAVSARVSREQSGLDALRSRPALADPYRLLDAHAQQARDLRDRARRCFWARVDRASDELTHARARVTALSPAATLERGYAVVQRRDDGHVVRHPEDAPAGTALRLRLAEGEAAATAG
nr:exodeoxyribonuclease VII large subunit [Motilibacter aurantiacus]